MGATDQGEAKAWELLATGDPAEVCRRAAVEHDAAAGCYTILSFGRRFRVDPAKREIASLDPGGELFLTRLGYFFRLTVLWYLVKAVDATPAGRLVKPGGLPGGEIYFRGSHVLPLDGIAKRFATDCEGFVAAGARFGGVPAHHGDAALELRPLPKVPTTVILWTEDDEFPARADLLFDASAPLHLPLDILWSAAMMTVLVLIQG